jgi:hypothetical protein
VITVARLRELLAQVPDDAEVGAYEGEDSGISIYKDGSTWWIRTTSRDADDTYTTGFEESR